MWGANRKGGQYQKRPQIPTGRDSIRRPPQLSTESLTTWLSLALVVEGVEVWGGSNTKNTSSHHERMPSVNYILKSLEKQKTVRELNALRLPVYPVFEDR